MPAAANTVSIAGGGRVGRALLRASKGSSCQLLRRETLGSVDPNEQCPILVCTTSDAVPDVYNTVPKSRRRDLVYASNGHHLRFFAQHGINPQEVSQALMYLSAQEDQTLRDGDFTAVTGPWAGEVQHFLQACGLQCAVLTLGPFTARMLQKLLWASVLWVVCHAHGSVTVGEACEWYREDIRALVFELYPIAQLYALEAVPEYMQHYMHEPLSVQEVLDGLLSYSQRVATAVPSLGMARTEFEWRNGFFLWRQPTPRHIELLRMAGCGDLADQAL